MAQKNKLSYNFNNNMKLIIKLLVNALAFYIVAYLIPGFEVIGYQALLVTSIVWGALSLLVKPIVVLLTLPINLVTLGLFTFIINAGLLLLTARIVDGFNINSFTTALISAVVLGIVNAVLNTLSKD